MSQALANDTLHEKGKWEESTTAGEGYLILSVAGGPIRVRRGLVAKF